MSEPVVYRGDDAVREAARYFGQKIIDPIAAHIIREEGFVAGEYDDDAGEHNASGEDVRTWGVGQTGDNIGKNFFTEVLPKYEQEARKVVKGYDELPEEGRAAVMSAVYRGDLKREHTTAKLLSEGKYLEASKEYLRNKEYKERKRKNPDDGVVQRMQRNALAFARMAENG